MFAGPATNKTLPEAQRTQGIASKLELSLQLNRMPLAWLEIWSTCDAISIDSHVDHQVAIFALETPGSDKYVKQT